jgi:hypothetical protein
LENLIGKNELLRKLETLDKRNLDKVDGFITGLIAQREYMGTFTEKKRPLLVNREQDE